MACNVTAKSGLSKGLEDALGTSVKGKLQGECFLDPVRLPQRDTLEV